MPEDRSDTGSLGEEEERQFDRGTIAGGGDRRLPKELTPSYDLFGNPIMPASSEQQSAGRSRDWSDRGSLYGSEQNLGSGGQRGGGSSSGSPSGSGISTVTYAIIAIAVVAVLVIGSLLVWGLFQKMHDLQTARSGSKSSRDKKRLATSASSHTGSLGGALDPGQIYNDAKPSVVSLKIVSQTLEIVVEKFQLVDPLADDDDSPIMASLDDNDKPSLFQKGKAVTKAIGILRTPKAKLRVMVILANGSPILIPLNDDLKPITKGGRAIALPLKCSFKKYVDESFGSGFYVQPNIVATSWHVVANNATGVAGFGGGIAQVTDKPAKYEITKKPIAFDKQHDLALLYIPGTDAPTLELQPDYGKLSVGAQVFAIGSPNNLTGSITDGIISADKLRGRNEQDPDSPKLYIQHSAKIDRGYGGGPLLDTDGEVIGINTISKGNGSINLAVAARFLQDLLDNSSTKNQIEILRKQDAVDMHGG